MAAVADDLEPISPELVLVSSPEVALRARALLPPPPATTFERRPLPPRTQAAPSVEERRRHSRLPWLVAAVLIAAAAVAWVVAPRPPGPSFAATTKRSTPRATAAPALPAIPTVPVASPASTTPTVPVQMLPVQPPAPAATTTAAHAASPPPTTTAAAKPTPTPKPKPAAKPKPAPTPPPASVGFVPARTWLWQPDTKAKAYDFRLSLNGDVVLHERTTQPRLELPRSFRFRAGTYRWTVTPVPAGGAGPLTDSSFTVTPAAAALANR